jgi:hypothetical protein
MICLIRPEGAKWDSPGQRPGYAEQINDPSPERAKPAVGATLPFRPFRAWANIGLITPGRCPGLSHRAPLGLRHDLMPLAAVGTKSV